MSEPIGRCLNEMAWKFRKAVKSECERKGISSSYFHVLLFLSQNQEKVVYQNDIVEFVRHKPSTISVALTNMENELIIERKKDKEDGRRTIIKLTKKGVELGLIIKTTFDKIESALTSCISDESRDKIYDFADKVNKTLEGWCN